MHEPNNGFYQSFDTETIDGPRTPDQIRTPFQHDRDRVIYTSAFRRLQAKTQVFRSGEYDFYRTRLTHSIEVAQIGRGICNYLKKTGSLLSNDFYIDPDLVEACCLAHDIGHPPFGHAGEKSLHRLMKAFGGFEGNAQTLRLLTETIFSDGPKRAGMNPTRAFIDGVLKYKTLFSHRKKEKHFIYDDQERFLRFVNGGTTQDCSISRAAEDNPAQDQRKSIECQIMDWADDTAYSLGDLIDGIRAKFITPYTIGKVGARQPARKRFRQRFFDRGFD
ncbi:MAG TPA: dNTP triphosphohydrolase [Bryobacteraceae bacterium]|nr:dNTP triphosphohydrolase [Bryobacteraceae bacterium]